MSRLKVLFVTRTFYPEIFGGGEVSAWHTARSVAGHAQVSVCCLSERIRVARVEMKGAITIHRYPWKKLPFFRRLNNLDYCWWQLRQAVEEVVARENPDVIHFLNFGAVYPVALHDWKMPVFATCNGPWFCDFGGWHCHGNKTCSNCTPSERFWGSFEMWGGMGVPYYLYNSLARWRLRRALLRCARVFPVSDAAGAMLVAEGILSSRLLTVYNPGQMQVADKGDVEVLREQYRLGNRRVLLFIGRLADDKGVGQVIEALPLLKNTAFVIVADKKRAYKHLFARVRQLGLEDRVVFAGFVDASLLPAYYSLAYAAILPCSIYETLSRFLVEACVQGIPIIATDVGGNREIVTDNGNGFLLKDASPEAIVDAVKRLTPEVRARMVKVALKKAGDFSPSEVAQRLVREYVAALKRD